MGKSNDSQPLREPIMTPFTKYFCTKGYTIKIGKVVNMMMAERSVESDTLKFVDPPV